MKISKFLIFGALAAVAIVIISSDQAEGFRTNVADNAGKWKDKLTDLAENAGDKLDHLKDTLSTEVKGLTKDARRRMLAILNEGNKTAKDIQNHVEEMAS